MANLKNVYCTYTGGGIYVCTAQLSDNVWLTTDLETYGTYDSHPDTIEEQYGCDYDTHWKDSSAPLPTWKELLKTILKSYTDNISTNMSPTEVERIINRYHPDLSLRIDEQ